MNAGWMAGAEKVVVMQDHAIPGIPSCRSTVFTGHFKDVTAKAGLAGTGYDTGVAIGDYDNDGYEDIFVGGVYRNALYHNNGDGTFTDVTAKAGLSSKPDPEYGPLWSVGGAWVDVNNDGLLDLLVVNYLQWNGDKEPVCLDNGHKEYCHPRFYGKTPNQLFLNNGDGTFTDVSVSSGFRAHPGKGMGVGVADYDLDGRMDFFIANDKLFNSLFHNKGGGNFDNWRPSRHYSQNARCIPTGVAARPLRRLRQCQSTNWSLMSATRAKTMAWLIAWPRQSENLDSSVLCSRAPMARSSMDISGSRARAKRNRGLAVT
jgi:hypothetical protein